MSVIDKITELINKDYSYDTFRSNQELFLEFYRNDMSLFNYDPRVIDICKYILSLCIDDNDEEFTLINSNIFTYFNRYVLRITQGVYSKGNFDDSYVDTLFKLIKDYYYFSKYKDLAINETLYDENSFIRDYTGSMMVLLNSSFFNISNENIKKMMNTIKNNRYLESIINSGKINDELLTKEYLYDYTSRFLFSSFFYNKNYVENDELLLAFKDGKINDKDTFKRILRNTNIYFLMDVFDNDLSLVVDMIEKTFKDEYIRVELVNYLTKKLYESENYDILMNFIINDSRTSTYIPDTLKGDVEVLFPYSNGEGLKDNEVSYYLNKGIDDIILLNNLREELNSDNNWSEETRNKVRELVKDVPYYELDTEQAIKCLDTLFKTGKGVNYSLFLAVMKRLVKDYTGDENVKVYVNFMDSITNGFSNDENNMIVINARSVKELFECTNFESEPDKLSIFNTLYHECKHLIQYKNTSSDDLSDEAYRFYKESILRSLCLEYYDNNYHDVAKEKDARISGAKGVVDLFSNYFPYMPNTISYYTTLMNKEINEPSKEEKEIFELSDRISVDEALDKIISINPSILIIFPGLYREYDINGNRINTGTER